jgi:hypothetical protein
MTSESILVLADLTATEPCSWGTTGINRHNFGCNEAILSCCCSGCHSAGMTSAEVKNAGMVATAPAETSTNYGTDPGNPSRADTVGSVDQELSSDEVTAFVTQALARADLDGKRVWSYRMALGRARCPFLCGPRTRLSKAGRRRSPW